MLNICWCQLQAVRNVLRECYGDKDAVTDELVDFILKPGLEVYLHSSLSFFQGVGRGRGRGGMGGGPSIKHQPLESGNAHISSSTKC